MFCVFIFYFYGLLRCYIFGGEVIVINGYMFDIFMIFIGDNGLFFCFWKGFDVIFWYFNYIVEVFVYLNLI